MRRFLLLSIATLAFTAVGFAQQLLPILKNQTGNASAANITGNFQSPDAVQSSTPISQWYSWLDNYNQVVSLEYGVSRVISPITLFLYPDSTKKIAYYDNTKAQFASYFNHNVSGGSVFDPKAHAVFQSAALSTLSSYT